MALHSASPNIGTNGIINGGANGIVKGGGNGPSNRGDSDGINDNDGIQNVVSTSLNNTQTVFEYLWLT